MRSRHDQLAAAFDQLARAGRAGPLDERTCRLVELALAIGARDRDAVRATHQRAVEVGVLADAVEQLVALAAPALGVHALRATQGWLGLTVSLPPTGPGPADA